LYKLSVFLLLLSCEVFGWMHLMFIVIVKYWYHVLFPELYIWWYCLVQVMLPWYCALSVVYMNLYRSLDFFVFFLQITPKSWSS
jgi:hypothetical protein